MSVLFEPFRLRTVDIPNRIWMSPMCQYSAAHDGADIGAPTPWHTAHLTARAVGGVGLVMVEATAVSAEGRITPGDLGLWNDRQQARFAELAERIAEHGGVPAIQIAHAGRKASTDLPWRGDRALTGADAWTTVGPSPLAYGDFPAPMPLGREQIKAIVADFAECAARAVAAGFRVIEIHAAHGYLIQSFLSPYSNQRDDEYGGSLENRMRLAVEIIDAVRAVVPDDLPLLLRVSATDWTTENPMDDRPGWCADDTVELAKVARDHGVDLVDVSTGGNVPKVAIPVEPAYQLPYATAVRTGAGVPVATVGMITTPRQAERIVADGQADAVMLGRELLRDPYWVHRAAQDLEAPATWPVQYAWAL